MSNFCSVIFVCSLGVSNFCSVIFVCSLGVFNFLIFLLFSAKESSSSEESSDQNFNLSQKLLSSLACSGVTFILLSSFSSFFSSFFSSSFSSSLSTSLSSLFLLDHHQNPLSSSTSVSSDTFSISIFVGRIVLVDIFD